MVQLRDGLELQSRRMAKKQKPSKPAPTTRRSKEVGRTISIPEGAKRKRRTKSEAKDWRPEFISAFRASGRVLLSIQACGVARSTFFAARQHDAEFGKLVDEIQDAYDHASVQEIAQGAIERAIHGELKLIEEIDSSGNVVRTHRTRTFNARREEFLMAKLNRRKFGDGDSVAQDGKADAARKMRELIAAMDGSVPGPSN